MLKSIFMKLYVNYIKKNGRNYGFTLLEIVVVLFIISMMAFFVASTFSTVTDKASINVAIDEMSNIKKSITDFFYPDLGIAPQDFGDDPADRHSARPWFATRFLCIRDDRPGLKGTPDSIEDPEAYEMLQLLGSNNEALLAWDRYRQKGWRGPYMEQDGTARTGSTYNNYYFPMVATPWADACEAMAQAMEDQDDLKEAEKFRRGKYYLIVTDKDGAGAPIDNTARIINFGANCLDDGSYHKDYADKEPTEFTKINDLRKPAPKKNSTMKNPDDYYSTGDDIVMFIFGGGNTRTPVTQ